MIKHTEEFKHEAVRIALTSGLPRERVAADLGIGKSTLGNQTLRDRCGIVLYIDAIESRHLEVVMMDQCIVTETHLARDGFHQRHEFVSCRYRPKCSDDGARQLKTIQVFRPC